MPKPLCRLMVLLLGFSGVSNAADPLIYANHMVYEGAFRVPQGTIGTSTLSYGGAGLAYNPANNSLFILGHDNHQQVMEISIPTPKTSSYNTATTLQSFADITEGNINNLGPVNGDGVTRAAITKTHGNIGGLMVYNGSLYGTVYPFYGTGADPANNVAPAESSHFVSGLTLSTTGDFSGMYAVGDSSNSPALYGGWMNPVPSAYQSALGGTAITGNGGVSVVSANSAGPSAFAFDPSSLTGDISVNKPVIPLLYYPVTHSTLGNAAPKRGTGASPYWSLSTRIRGSAIVPGTRSMLFFGYHGLNNYYYGSPTADPSLIYTDNGTGSTYYWDPIMMNGKGPHQYPYIYQVWAYDLDDLAHVKNGDTITAENRAHVDASCSTGTTFQPWCVKPYAIWEMPTSSAGVPSTFKTTTVYGEAVAYDYTNGKLYVSQQAGDTVGYSPYPLIHVFSFNTGLQPASSYSVKARVQLLKGTVTVNNGVSDIPITAESRTTEQIVPLGVAAPGAAYNITLVSQPTNQTCEVINGIGTVNANSDVTNILITCEGEGSSPSPISGSCGSSSGLALASAPVSGLCSAGTPSAVTGTGPWSWSCAGSGGGSTASCGASLAASVPAGDPSTVVACPVIAGFR